MEIRVCDGEDLEDFLIGYAVSFDDVKSHITDSMVKLISQPLFFTRFIKAGYIDFNERRVFNGLVRRQGATLIRQDRPLRGIERGIFRPFFSELGFDGGRHRWSGWKGRGDIYPRFLLRKIRSLGKGMR